ncbi:MAG: GIY-YIG nuclease family protein [Gammaproteobacteria bacterium]|nr:GIY-YIG nuclease family protein [Gammaproteobacteria bacterium]
MNTWAVYILECKDKTLYTGITNNLERRIQQHESGQGAKYTKGRGPFRIIYTESCEDQSMALKREHQIKQLTKQGKLDLITPSN